GSKTLILTAKRTDRGWGRMPRYGASTKYTVRDAANGRKLRDFKLKGKGSVTLFQEGNQPYALIFHEYVPRFSRNDEPIYHDYTVNLNTGAIVAEVPRNH